jgi:hypothetical protein
MPFPEQWAKAAIEAAGSCSAYPLIAPESAALPYVIYGRVSTARESIMAGSVAVNVSPAGTFQVEIYAATYSESKTLADSVRLALHNFNGTASGVTIRQCLLLEERDGDPVFFDGQDKPTFMVEHTYQIRWQE